MAELELALQARFVPDEGFLGLRAQLTRNSYLLSRNCRLTGGFAFYCWFSGEYAGDFVLTLGGYHPRFAVPEHYPQVPRLGFNWPLTSQLTIKGGAYLALTPKMMMLGVALEASWVDGNLKAWFKASLDFLVAWKPFFYSATASLSLGYRYRIEKWGIGKTFSGEVGANLSIWGPEFSGKVSVTICKIEFGVSFGGKKPREFPLDWKSFQQSFLPDPKEVISITVISGLRPPTDDRTSQKEKSPSHSADQDIPEINPKEFVLVIDSKIPVKTSVRGALKSQKIPHLGSAAKFGIAPMQLGAEQIQSQQQITLKRRKGKESIPVDQEFAFTPLRKNVPTALWGLEFRPRLNGSTLIENALCGLEVRPKASPAPGKSQAIDRKNLQFSLKRVEDAYDWEKISPETITTEQEPAQRRATIRQSLTQKTPEQTQANLLAALGFSPEDVNVSQESTEDYLAAPQVGRKG